MGVSWSNNRMRNDYLQNRPSLAPPPPPPPSELLSEPPSLLPPPQPPPPFPPPHNNSFTSNPPDPPPPHPPHNLYPAHTPPIHSSSPYCSGPYNFSNYANPMMDRSNYQPSYSNRSNYWTPIRPPVAAPLLQQQPVQSPPPPHQPPRPPPHFQIQNACTIINDANVQKHTLRLEVDERNPGHYLVSFTFDAALDGSITIYYFAKEEVNCRFSQLFPEAFMPMTIPFQKGLGQKFRQPSGTGIDLGFFALDNLSKPSPEGDVFPLVISAETSTSSHMSLNMQITQAVFEKQTEDLFQVRVIKKMLWVNGLRYELQVIYGMETNGFDDNDFGKECVICLTEPKTATVLPCGHMCMCSECAKQLRFRSNKCPICRQPIERLLEIKIIEADQ